jgi:hypothetical protein
MRYALLFSGMSFRRHVNGLELCYRTLIDGLGFAAHNIHVLNYDGSARAFGDLDEGSEPLWPGDGSPFRLTVRAEGSRAAFQQTLATIASQLTAADELFINTMGHGGHRGAGRGPDLLTYPCSRRFSRDDFCAAISNLPPHRSLVVLMAQCHSGGFNQAVLEASPAASTFIASAASELRPSFMTLDNGHWDSFQVNWLNAVTQRLTVGEAFQRACTGPARNPYDSPEFAARPPSARHLRL